MVKGGLKNWIAANTLLPNAHTPIGDYFKHNLFLCNNHRACTVRFSHTCRSCAYKWGDMISRLTTCETTAFTCLPASFVSHNHQIVRSGLDHLHLTLPTQSYTLSENITLRRYSSIDLRAQKTLNTYTVCSTVFGWWYIFRFSSHTRTLDRAWNKMQIWPVSLRLDHLKRAALFAVAFIVIFVVV